MVVCISAHTLQSRQSSIPPYGQRGKWRPKQIDNFDDGGAFPEVHIAQFPLDMGRKDKATSSAIIPLTTDASGKIQFDAVLGKHDKKKVYSSARDLIEYEPNETELELPTEEEIQETTERTRNALSKLINNKIAAAIPAQPAEKQAAPTYFQYTPQGKEEKRIVKLVEMPKDPMEPPNFKHKKVVRGPGSPPVPVVHSPPRKLQAKDIEDWKIPPCISNWKNQRGLTISLDKRLAADGRGLQKPQINEKFAQFAESLYLAERNARVMVESRTEITRMMAEKERQSTEEALTQMAMQGRKIRAGLPVDSDDRDSSSYSDESREMSRMDRDQVREERRRQTEREMRLENLGHNRKRDEQRDIGERIALGQAAPTLTGEAMFDQRLFNQSQGMSTGFGSEDSYNVFDKPLFHGSSANQLFRPKKSAESEYGSEADLDELKNMKRFQGGKGFEAKKDSNTRSAPVEFEKSVEPDEFGFLDEFMDEAKTKKMNDALSKTNMSINAPRRPAAVPPSVVTRDHSRSPSDRRQRGGASPQRSSPPSSDRRHHSPDARRRSRSPPTRRSSPPRGNGGSRRSPDRRRGSDRDRDYDRDRRYDSDRRDRDYHSSRRDDAPRGRDYKRSRDYDDDREPKRRRD